MYKVLLVDDEFLTRDAIAKNTPWKDAGFQLIGTAENGKYAIDVLEREKPDLVLTDICMPVMDGLELAAYIHEHHPSIRVIIISGYDDFEYAKQALKYEVSDYILKPITSYELVEELKKVAEKIDASMEQQVQVEKIRWEYEKNIPTLRSNFLTRLMEGNYLKKDIDAQMMHLKITIDGQFQAVVMIDVEDSSSFRVAYPEATEDLINFSVANITEELVEQQKDILFFENTENRSLLVFSSDQKEALQPRIEQVGTQIVEAIQKYLQIKVCILVGETVSGPMQWDVSYNSVLSARENKFLLEKHTFVYGKDFAMNKLPGGDAPVHLQTSQLVDKIILMIKLNHKGELREEVAKLFEEFRASGCARTTIFLHVQNIVLTILINLEDNTADMSDEAGEVEFIHHLSDYKHLSEVQSCFLRFCENTADSIAGKRENINQKQAVLALDYIEKNYQNVDMSLNMVCAYLCVSTSYFSTFFKNATGETFVEALTRIRMEKAKKLLETTNMKSYEVALEVGYNDPHYFSSIFKKRQGMTPTEYVRQFHNMTEN